MIISSNRILINLCLLFIALYALSSNGYSDVGGVDESTKMFNKGAILWLDSENNESQKKACDLFEESAIHGYSQAEHNLGDCYRLGRGRNKDFSKAKLWYKKSIASSGSIRSYISLTSIVLYEDKTCPDQAVFPMLAKVSEDSNLYPYATFMLGEAYLKGRCGERDIRKGVELLSSSGESGHLMSQALLYYAYESGLYEIQQDKTKAAYWKERFESNINKPEAWTLDYAIEGLFSKGWGVEATMEATSHKKK